MNPLPFWLVLLLLFLAGFAFASLMACVVYCVWGLRSLFVQVAAGLFSVLVTFCCVGVFLLTLVVDAKFALSALLVVLAFSVGQAFFERAIDSQMRSNGYHRARSLISYLCSAALGLLVSAGLSELQVYSTNSVLLSYGSSGNAALMGGYVAGFFFAPLSISFFRWMIPSLHLRPGKDRLLEEGDALYRGETVSH